MEERSPLVLSVEDDPDTQDMLALLLTDTGYRFKAVSNCADALKSIREQRAALILIDDRLEDGSGIELCRQVREFDRNTPIVISTGAYGERIGASARSAGANAFITKPYPLNDLFTVLAEYAPLAEKTAKNRT